MFSLDTRRFSLEARCCLSSYVVHLAELHHCVPDKTPSCRCTRVQEADVKLKDNGWSPDQVFYFVTMLSIEFFNRWNSGDVGSRRAFVPSPRSYLKGLFVLVDAE